MRLGIDFGTTRTVVAVSDRGNYPVLGFADAAGDTCEFFPSVVAELGGELRFGFDALALAADPAATQVRSFKRILADATATPEQQVTVGAMVLPLGELLTRFLGAVREAILFGSNLPASAANDQELQAVVAVPANSLGAQRFLTLDAFRRAGFDVRSLLNEPSAAGFEYTHRHGETVTARREHVVVYDLGGGTFDSSLVRVSGAHHDVLSTAGLNQLGGDDFDEVLVRLVLKEAKLTRRRLPARARALLVDQCREAKERLNPSSRRIAVEIDAELTGGEAIQVTVAATDFYEACQPLVDRTVEAMRPVLEKLLGEEDELARVAGIYVVGGGSALPVVARTLRERFGRRVHKSPYPSAATAIGLAIAADEEAGYQLTDRFSRNFGVFREGAAGRQVTFDPIFSREEKLPRAAENAVVSRRVYRAAHNLGHFRFVECAALEEGTPRGDIMPFADVFFPFDPALRRAADPLGDVAVRRTPEGEGPLIEEQYSVDAHGIVEVRIKDLGDGFERAYRLGSYR